MRQALVTGGGGDGLGGALAVILARRGWMVTAGCRTDAQRHAAERRADEPRIAWIRLDLSSDADIAALPAHLSARPLDLVVNCAAHARREPTLADVGREGLLEAMSVNVYGLFALARALAPSLRAAADPWFVAIGSTMGSFADPTPQGRFSYRTSKAAAHMAIRILACETMLEGIGLAALHPGWVRTKLGGPDAPLSAEEAATDLADLLERLGPEAHGGLIDRFGNPLPW